MGRPRKSHALDVWMNGARVGRWDVSAQGKHTFTYEPGWVDAEQARPISLSMPLRPAAQPYSGDVVRSFFDNLLPDTEELRQRIQQRFSLDSTEPQELLKQIGRDCVGALQLLPAGDQPKPVEIIQATPLDEKAVERHLLELPNLGRHDDGEDFRISLAGAQEKTALLWHDGRWNRADGTTPTTHIFKLPIGKTPRGIDLSTSVENEWLCAAVLRALGLEVAACSMQTFGEAKALVVTRFDRRPSSDGRWLIRIPQEDLAQATGTPPARKYEGEGGPGIKQCLDLLLGSSNATADRLDFFRTQLCFFLLFAIDGHAKNFSVFIEPRGTFRLTPRYDVLSAHPVVGDAPGQRHPRGLKMAMALWGDNRHYHWGEIERRHFERTAKDCGLGEAGVAAIDALAAAAPAAVDRVQHALPAGFPEQVSRPILDGVRQAAARLSRR